MFNIIIASEETGRKELEIVVEDYMFIGKIGGDVKRSFSSHDTVQQLGLLEFTKTKIVQEIATLPEKKD